MRLARFAVGPGIMSSHPVIGREKDLFSDSSGYNSRIHSVIDQYFWPSCLFYFTVSNVTLCVIHLFVLSHVYIIIC